MMPIVLNIALTSILLSLVLWVSKKNPILGGFILSLPLSTLIVLALSKIQNDDPGNTTLLAKSIFIGVPASLLFFVPFLLAERLVIQTLTRGFREGVGYRATGWRQSRFTNENSYGFEQ